MDKVKERPEDILALKANMERLHQAIREQIKNEMKEADNG